MPPLFPGISQTHQRDLPRLLAVWESSARATHAFLSEADIQALIPLVRAELADFSPIYCLRESDAQAYAFLGVAGRKIEMLFVHGDRRGAGAGRLLSEFAMRALHADCVDVNEQNLQAVGFYMHLGFRQVRRSALDAAGNPFPILHMALHPKRSSRTEAPAIRQFA